MPNHNDHLNIEANAALVARVLDAVSEAVITSTLDGVVTAWNRAAQDIFGYTAEEMMGQNVTILMPPDRAHEASQLTQRLARRERIEDFATMRARKNGQLVEVALTLSPITDDIGYVVGVLRIVKDIRDQRRLEIAERDQALLASIVASADDAIVSKSIDGIVTSWNTAAEKMFGYKADEMIGKPVALLIPSDHPDEEPQILQRIRRGERIDHYETKRVRKDGGVLDVALTVSPIRDKIGRIIGASKIIRDITERKRWQKAELAESFLGALVESADDAIISKNLDGVVRSWNPAAERLYGYSAEEMIGKPISLLVPADHPDEEPQILQRIRRGERIEHYETKRVKKDGSVIDVALTVSPIRDGLGRIIGASKIARDVSRQKQAIAREREALRQAEEAKRHAEQASAAKDDFLATVSHELRTPLTAILGWTRMLMNGALNPTMQQKAMETIDRNARSQAQLIEDLLDISRIVSGKLRVEFKTVDIATVIAAAVESVRPAAVAKRIQIRTVISSGAVPILGDPERLQQVVWNLLSNAIKFSRVDGLVQLDLQRVESQIEIRVTDQGIGIRPEFLPHIFERFTQSDSSITRTHGGIGIGLAIVKSLVELHGGVVAVSSAGEGQGAVFTVKLPVSAVMNDPRERLASKSPAQNFENALKDRPELVGLKILIVDDQQDTCELLSFVFDECGSIVKTATTAEEGLQLFDSWEPDILISDISMPGVDGYEFIRMIRENRKSGIPAVALTAMARIDDRIKALSAGYQMHVSKPVEPLELISIVTSLRGLVNRRPPA
jgi:PAS domain S-box-containing protein